MMVKDKAVFLLKGKAALLHFAVQNRNRAGGSFYAVRPMTIQKRKRRILQWQQ